MRGSVPDELHAVVDGGGKSFKEHAVLPECEVVDEVSFLAKDEGAVCEEGGVGVDAEVEVWHADCDDEGGHRVWDIDGVDAGDLLVLLEPGAVGAFGGNGLSVGVDIHPDGLGADGDVGVAGDGEADVESQGAVVGRELDVDAEPCEGAAVVGVGGVVVAGLCAGGVWGVGWFGGVGCLGGFVLVFVVFGGVDFGQSILGVADGPGGVVEVRFGGVSAGLDAKAPVVVKRKWGAEGGGVEVDDLSGLWDFAGGGFDVSMGQEGEPWRRATRMLVGTRVCRVLRGSRGFGRLGRFGRLLGEDGCQRGEQEKGGKAHA